MAQLSGEEIDLSVIQYQEKYNLFDIWIKLWTSILL